MLLLFLHGLLLPFKRRLLLRQFLLVLLDLLVRRLQTGLDSLRILQVIALELNGGRYKLVLSVVGPFNLDLSCKERIYNFRSAASMITYPRNMGR